MRSSAYLIYKVVVRRMDGFTSGTVVLDRALLKKIKFAQFFFLDIDLTSHCIYLSSLVCFFFLPCANYYLNQNNNGVISGYSSAVSPFKSKTLNEKNTYGRWYWVYMDLLSMWFDF